MVVANVRTMEAALRLADRLDHMAICAMQGELLAGDIKAGQLRAELVWVGTNRNTPRGASHVAPQHDLVPPAIDDLIAFMARDDLPVLVHTAIAHAQFETIHPFTDGNGRTGRALVPAMLRSKGLVTSTTAPLSAGLLTDTVSYVAALEAYRRGDARPIVEAFAADSRFAATTGQQLVDTLAAQVTTGRDLLATAGLRPQALAWRVPPALVGQSVVNARYLQDHLAMNSVGAQRALDQLTTAGVLVECTGLRRNRVWQHTGIIDVLEDYAASLRRS